MMTPARLREQPFIILVNASRRNAVDAGAVALREGRLGGVILDTFEGKRSGLKKNFSNRMIWRPSC